MPKLININCNAVELRQTTTLTTLFVWFCYYLYLCIMELHNDFDFVKRVIRNCWNLSHLRTAIKLAANFKLKHAKALNIEKYFMEIAAITSYQKTIIT